MNKQIYEYRFSGGRNRFVKLMIREGGKLLSIQNQGGDIVAWFEHESPVTDKVDFVSFLIMGTGMEFIFELAEGSALEYFTTVQDGPLVWHIYRVIYPDGRK